MRIAIVSNIDNAKGLQRDFHLLRDLLTGWGHEVVGLHFQRAATPPRRSFDLLIFLEVCEPRFFDCAPRIWCCPNPEWWEAANDVHLSAFEAVLCKTRDALRLFGPRTPLAEFTGFLSEDHHQPAVPRTRAFLHSPGGSSVKGTQAVLESWRRFHIRHRLTVTGPVRVRLRLPAMRLHRVVDDRCFAELQNVHAFHLCPSEYEGWGHYLHEGLGVGAAVATTAAPPMGEVEGVAHLIPPAGSRTQRLATTWQVTPEGVRDAVELLAGLSDAEIDEIHQRARAAFLAEADAFRAKLRAML